MKRSVYFSLFLIAALGLTNCMKPDCGCDPKPEIRQPVLFQYEYYNYAWGFRHHGFLIDESGKLNGFYQPGKWIVADSAGMISKSDLEYNLLQCDTVCGKVDVDELMEYFNKIEDVRMGKILDNGMMMADAGTGELSAWYWNRTAGKYQNVFLISNGDVSRVNTHPDVKKMVEWLKKAGEKTHRFYWFNGL